MAGKHLFSVFLHVSIKNVVRNIKSYNELQKEMPLDQLRTGEAERTGRSIYTRYLIVTEQNYSNLKLINLQTR